MLKKRNRLKTIEFNNVFKNGKKFFSKNFLLFRSNVQNSDRKISVAISKKVERRAVDRIRSKRTIYEIIRNNFDVFPENVYIIILITKPILNLDRDSLVKEILELKKKLKIEN